jgi:hypothetical protein
MKLLYPALAVLMLVAACASDPDTAEARNRPDCRNVDPPTGSRLVRKQDCVPTSEAGRDQAQQNARQLQDLQQQITPGILK